MTIFVVVAVAKDTADSAVNERMAEEEVVVVVLMEVADDDEQCVH